MPILLSWLRPPEWPFCADAAAAPVLLEEVVEVPELVRVVTAPPAGVGVVREDRVLEDLVDEVAAAAPPVLDSAAELDPALLGLKFATFCSNPVSQMV
jgi:hypothetical protein